VTVAPEKLLPEAITPRSSAPLKVGISKVNPIHQHIREVGPAEVSLAERRLGEDRTPKIGTGEVGPHPLSPRKGGGGKLLSAEIAVALVGEGVINPVLEVRPGGGRSSCRAGAAGSGPDQAPPGCGSADPAWSPVGPHGSRLGPRRSWRPRREGSSSQGWPGLPPAGHSAERFSPPMASSEVAIHPLVCRLALSRGRSACQLVGSSWGITSPSSTREPATTGRSPELRRHSQGRPALEGDSNRFKPAA
jgi:hypothetical protein